MPTGYAIPAVMSTSDFDVDDADRHLLERAILLHISQRLGPHHKERSL